MSQRILERLLAAARRDFTCLALDAGKCLLIDGDAILHAADEAAIAIVADAV